MQHFTYFQTRLTLPADLPPSTLTVRLANVDDGARVTVFNSAHPTGVTAAGSDLKFGGPLETADLYPYVVAGESNRIVVTQVDDCMSGNSLSQADILLDGDVVPTNCSAPASGCLTAAKSLLLLKDKGDDSPDKLVWKWIKGAQLDQTGLANPTVGDGYTLCVYAGPTNTPIAAAPLSPGAGWSANGPKGYKFKGVSPDGLGLAILKSGAAGKSKALAKGKGAALPDPILPLAYPVTVQLRKDGSSLCLGSIFTPTDQKQNNGTKFKAKH